MVGVVIFLELDWCKTIAGKGGWRRQLLDEFTYIIWIYIRHYDKEAYTYLPNLTSRSLVNWVILVDLNLHSTPRREFRDYDRVRNLLEDHRVGFAPESIVVGMEVCSGNDKG